MSAQVHIETATPAAWLGMAEGFKRPTVRICCRCPDKAEAEALATSRGLDMSHGECPECHAKVMAEIEQFYRTRKP